MDCDHNKNLIPELRERMRFTIVPSLCLLLFLAGVETGEFGVRVHGCCCPSGRMSLRRVMNNNNKLDGSKVKGAFWWPNMESALV